VSGPDRNETAASKPHSFGAEAAIMKARVTVSLKPGVLDPQGRAIAHALEALGFSSVRQARVGKVIELEVAPGTTEAEVAEMARKLLANTVIESFRVEMIETEPAA
jgi:phosphoribosylformylglycinamidine synthase PurS subunit